MANRYSYTALARQYGSILANHQNDFTSWRYLGENPCDLASSGKDLHAALDTLIATYEEIWGFDP